MNDTKRNGLRPGFWRKAWRSLAQVFSADDAARQHRNRCLAPLLELEDRRLLSATPVGAAFRANTFINGSQQTSPQTPQAVAVNPATGAYVVVWSSQGQNTGGGWDVYFQLYNAAGQAQGNETLVDTHFSGANQQNAAVAMNGNGNFVVTWSGNQLGHWNVYAQQFNAGSARHRARQSSSTTRSTTINSIQPSASTAPATLRLPGKGRPPATTWESTPENSIPAAPPRPASFRSASASSRAARRWFAARHCHRDEREREISVVTWTGQNGNQQNVLMQLYAAGATPVGSIFQVNPASSVSSEYASAAIDGGGNFVITWQGQTQGSNNWNVYEQQNFSATGGAR